MAITLFVDGDRKYFRVTRAWGGKEYQDYVRIKRSESKAYAEAQEIDNKLKVRQAAYQLRQQKSVSRFFHANGKVVGLSKVLSKRKGRKDRWEFKLRVNLPNEPKPRFTAIGINKYGFDQAFQLAIDKICEWHGIDKHSEIRKLLIDAKKQYENDLSVPDAEEIQESTAVLDSENVSLLDFEKGLTKERENFLEKFSDSRVINGR